MGKLKRWAEGFDPVDLIWGTRVFFFASVLCVVGLAVILGKLSIGIILLLWVTIVGVILLSQHIEYGLRHLRYSEQDHTHAVHRLSEQVSGMEAHIGEMLLSQATMEEAMPRVVDALEKMADELRRMEHPPVHSIQGMPPIKLADTGHPKA